MKKHLPFFLIALALIANAVYWPLRWVQTHATSAGDAGEIGRVLAREAELVEHFCLSRYTPMPGRSAIPAEWEKALGSRIRLRDNVGEVVSEAPQLASRADEIRNLAPGKVLHAKMSQGATGHMVVARPRSTPNQFLIISKSEAAPGENPRGLPANPLAVALLSALIAALILTVARAALPSGTAIS